MAYGIFSRFSEYAAQHVFGSLDRHHSQTTHSAFEADGMADGYCYVAGHAFGVESTIPAEPFASGGLIASAESMAHFAIAQLNDGRHNGAWDWLEYRFHGVVSEDLRIDARFGNLELGWGYCSQRHITRLPDMVECRGLAMSSEPS